MMNHCRRLNLILYIFLGSLAFWLPLHMYNLGDHILFKISLSIFSASIVAIILEIPNLIEQQQKEKEYIYLRGQAVFAVAQSIMIRFKTFIITYDIQYENDREEDKIITFIEQLLPNMSSLKQDDQTEPVKSNENIRNLKYTLHFTFNSSVHSSDTQKLLNLIKDDLILIPFRYQSFSIYYKDDKEFRSDLETIIALFRRIQQQIISLYELCPENNNISITAKDYTPELQGHLLERSLKSLIYSNTAVFLKRSYNFIKKYKVNPDILTN